MGRLHEWLQLMGTVTWDRQPHTGSGLWPPPGLREVPAGTSPALGPASTGEAGQSPGHQARHPVPSALTLGIVSRARSEASGPI